MTPIQTVKMVVQSPSKLKRQCKMPKLGSGEPLFSAASAHWPENLIFAFNQTATSFSLQDICIKIQTLNAILHTWVAPNDLLQVSL